MIVVRWATVELKNSHQHCFEVSLTGTCITFWFLSSYLIPLPKKLHDQGQWVRGGSTLGPGGTPPQMLASPPQIFWFQQQKYALLKSKLFLYSGEINTRINYCISNDDIADQNPNEGANKAVKHLLCAVCWLLYLSSLVSSDLYRFTYLCWFKTLLPALFSVLQKLATSLLY